jgi:hypothetical protein
MVGATWTQVAHLTRCKIWGGSMETTKPGRDQDPAPARDKSVADVTVPIAHSTRAGCHDDAWLSGD